MRAALFLLTAVLLVQGSTAAAWHGGFAIATPQQKDRLEGRWSGTVEGIQGKQEAFVTFKKEGEGYTGKISGMRPGMEAALKNVKLDGDKITAKTDFETPQGSLTVNYNFTLAGESLKGKGETEFGGQTFSFDFDMKRTSTDPAAAPPPGAATAQTPPPRREVPQPQQKQSIDYFVGQWAFNWIGRESALGPAPREGTATFTKRADGKSLDVRIDGRADGKPFSETAVLTYDEGAKTLTLTERRSNGVQIQSKGDWRSPISIRFTVDPIKVKGQTLMLKRTISVVAAHSFTLTEELAEDGGPFVRLGNAVYSKIEAK
jgi:hypothetical protein